MPGAYFCIVLRVDCLNAICCLLLYTIQIHGVWASKPYDSTKIRVMPVPTLGYTPETRGYAGAVCQLAFKSDPGTRLSAVKTEFQFTQKRQTILELAGSIFLPAEKCLINFTAHSSRFPDFWWGVGIHTPEINKEGFNSRRNWLELAILKNAGRNWFIGPLLKHQQRSNIEFNQTTTASFMKVSAVGIQFLHDSRDNMLNPTKGNFIDIQLTRNIAGNAGTGYRSAMDSRFYKKAGKSNTLAGRMTFSHLSSNTHFFDLALLGGDRNLRGYYLGRFRDRGMLVFNGELRTAMHKRWGMALGVGAGTVFRQPEDIFKNPFKPAFNAGLRFLADRRENINMRIDYAIGVKGQSGFYFAFGEAF